MAHRLLVADDDDAFRTFAAVVLREGGYDVVCAANGQEALGLVDDQGPFELFVLDLLMPRMSGEEVAERLRFHDHDAKMLYCTNFSDRLFTDKSMLFGDEAFIDKPATPSGLLEAVSMLLFGHLHGPAGNGGRSPHP